MDRVGPSQEQPRGRKDSLKPHTVQYVMLAAFSAILVSAADRAFGSGEGRWVQLDSIRRGAVAAKFQLRTEHVATLALGDLSAIEANAARWLAETTWQDGEVRGDAVTAGTDREREITREATPLDELGVAQALIDGHRLAFGSAPSAARLGVAWAHIALENGRGREIYCNNFGNIGANGRWEGRYFVRLLKERVQKNPDVWKVLDIKFRAFATPPEGARTYWKVLEAHYGSALAYFDSGYAFEAGRRLTNGGYATALTEPYSLSMVKLNNEYKSRIDPLLSGHTP